MYVIVILQAYREDCTYCIHGYEKDKRRDAKWRHLNSDNSCSYCQRDIACRILPLIHFIGGFTFSDNH